MVVWVVDAFVLHVQILDFINSQINGFNDEVALKRKACTVSEGLVVIKLDEELVILETLYDSLDHREVIRPADMVFESVHHYIFHKVKLKHP